MPLFQIIDIWEDLAPYTTICLCFYYIFSSTKRDLLPFGVDTKTYLKFGSRKSYLKFWWWNWILLVEKYGYPAILLCPFYYLCFVCKGLSILSFENFGPKNCCVLWNTKPNRSGFWEVRPQNRFLNHRTALSLLDFSSGQDCMHTHHLYHNVVCIKGQTLFKYSSFP